MLFKGRIKQNKFIRNPLLLVKKLLIYFTLAVEFRNKSLKQNRKGVKYKKNLMWNNFNFVSQKFRKLFKHPFVEVKNSFGKTNFQIARIGG